MSPAVPHILLAASPGQLSFLILNFSSVLMSIAIATTAATAFLKNAFCIVGRSPDILTKNVISEKKNPAMIMNRIPLYLSFITRFFDI